VDLTGGCGTRYGISGSRGISQGWDGSSGSGSSGMLRDVAGQPGQERKASGRCKVLRGLWDVMVCRMMSRDVGKGLDPKQDERKTSCTAGDEVCRRRRVMPRETRYAAGDETYRGRRVQETGLEA